jgi:hypothetical protein
MGSDLNSTWRMGDWIHQWHSISYIYIYVNTYCSNGYRRPVLVLPLLKQKKHASVGGQLEAPHFRGHRHMFPKRCPPYSYCCFICFVVLWVTKERRFLTLAMHLYANHEGPFGPAVWVDRLASYFWTVARIQAPGPVWPGDQRLQPAVANENPGWPVDRRMIFDLMNMKLSPCNTIP